MKPILIHAIQIEGTRKKLASALGVSPCAITMWAKRSMPEEREAQLEKLYARRKPKPKKQRKEWKPKTKIP